jgi:hypothetical protein
MGLLTNLKPNDVFRDEKSLAFDGTNDYVETSFVPDYISTNATVAFWVKMNDFSADQYMGIHNNKRWYHGFSTDKIFFGVANAHNGSSLITPSPALVIGQWIHYCVTAIDGTATAYINGVAQGTISYSQSSSYDPDSGYFIGARDNSGAGNYLNCNISEVAQYNVGLTANQVKTIYNGREPYNHKEGVASGNLQAWYRMGDGSLDDFNLIGDETNATLGSDLITNGGFDADSDWTKDNFSIGSGVATTSTNGASIQQPISISVGDVIKIVAEIKNYTSGSIRYYTGSGVDEWRTFNSNGVHTHYLVANSTKVLFYSQSFNGSLDNVKVYKVNGNAGTMINMDIVDIEGDTP